MKRKLITLMVSAAVLGENPAFGMLDDSEKSNNPIRSQTVVTKENDENTVPPKTVTFFTSLFEPFTNHNAQEFYKSQMTQVTDEGVTNYAYGKARQCLTTIKNNPSDAFIMGGAMALGWVSVEEYFPLIPLAVGVVNSVKHSQTLCALAGSITSETIMQKGLKIALYGGAVYSVASLPAAAALDWNSLADPSHCPIPEGSYLGSCQNTTVMSYKSTDPLVPVNTCVLTTQCNSIIPSIPPTNNTIYFQSTSDVRFGNNNGTLTVLNELGKESQIPAKGSITCTALPGSHDLSCQLDVSPYTSTDENLKTTPFCEMKSRCRTLANGQTTLNTVYFGHENQRGADVVAENCDGRLVIHGTRKSDGMCAKKTPNEIKDIAQKKGETTQVIKEEL
jgi:hypothetical protein